MFTLDIISRGAQLQAPGTAGGIGLVHSVLQLENVSTRLTVSHLDIAEDSRCSPGGSSWTLLDVAGTQRTGDSFQSQHPHL